MKDINWREWNEDSFREAREANRPVLLSISAVWCHWCHVMDSTSYSDDRVVELANSRFIPIRIDTDRRPDINARYNMGGWPSTVFLTPDADILTGATYLPPAQMIELMQRVADVFASNRDELSTRAKSMRGEFIEAGKPVAEPTSLLTEGIVSRVLRSIRGRYDQRYGGFGSQQKFPHTDTLDLLLMDYHRTGDKDTLEMITKTLDSMDDGDIHDKVGGGFFRYATQNDWSAPHYEKMLQDNASLLATYVAAYQETGQPSYLSTAMDITKYLEDWLYDQERGAFYGSQDADEEYYALSAEGRSERQAPRVDKTFYTNWNAMAAYGYLRLYQVTLDIKHRGHALRCLDFLLNDMRGPDGTFAHFYDGEAKQFGILNDQMNVLWALVAAYESTGEMMYRDRALELAKSIRDHFTDPEGGLFDVTEERMQREQLIYRDKSLEDNALAARAFERLSVIAHDVKWKREAEEILRSFIPVYENYGMMAAPYALAVQEVLDEPVKVSIAGDRESVRTMELLEQALKAKEPRKIVQVLDAGAMETEMDEFGYLQAEEPAAYICHGSTCQAPITDPEKLAAAVASAGGHAVDLEEA